MENKNSKVDKIIKELEQNLSKMTNEEREIFFKEMGFVFIEKTPKERKQQLINLLTALRAVLQEKIKYAKALDPLQYYEYKAQYARTEAERIMSAIRLGDLEDKHRKPEVVGTRITEEPYAHDANRELDKKTREINALEIAAQVDPKNQIIYGDKSKGSKEDPKTGTEEMMAMLGIQGCLVPGSKEEHIDISDEHLRILGAQIDEDVRKCEQAMQESVAYLIRKGPKL